MVAAHRGFTAEQRTDHRRRRRDHRTGAARGAGPPPQRVHPRRRHCPSTVARDELAGVRALPGPGRTAAATSTTSSASCTCATWSLADGGTGRRPRPAGAAAARDAARRRRAAPVQGRARSSSRWSSTSTAPSTASSPWRTSLEEIVGEIYDETDRDVLAVAARAPTASCCCPARSRSTTCPTSASTSTQPPDGDYTTIAGLVLASLGHIPTAPGETVTLPGWTAEVTAVDRRAITQIRLRPTPGQEPDTER